VKNQQNNLKMIGKFAVMPTVNYPYVYSTLGQVAHSLDALYETA